MEIIPGIARMAMGNRGARNEQDSNAPPNPPNPPNPGVRLGSYNEDAREGSQYPSPPVQGYVQPVYQPPNINEYAPINRGTPEHRNLYKYIYIYIYLYIYIYI